MGADQIASIRPALEELLKANAEGIDNLCVTFVAPSRPAAWLQFMEGVINFAYPFEEEPTDFLARKKVVIPPGFSVDCFEPGLYATIAHDSHDAQVLAQFADQLFAAVHGLDTGSYDISVEMEHL